MTSYFAIEVLRKPLFQYNMQNLRDLAEPGLEASSVCRGKDFLHRFVLPRRGDGAANPGEPTLMLQQLEPVNCGQLFSSVFPDRVIADGILLCWWLRCGESAAQAF